MSRSRIEEALSKAVRESRITLLHGLPRVGRTVAARRWASGRDDVSTQTFQALRADLAPILLYDHLSSDDVPGFVARFRTCESSADDTRFIVIPVDLATTRLLQTALTGSVRTLDLDPVQLHDYVAQWSITSSAAGPSPNLIAQPEPSNAPACNPEIHWLRGGLPESLYADNDQASLSWRRQMLDGLLSRDYSSWGIQSGFRFPDILRWVANQNGGEFDENACQIAKRSDLLSAVYVLDRLQLTRRLPNYPAGSSPSLAKKPKLYIRDSGILHALLGIETINQLRNHPKVGDSWEGYAIETLILATGGIGTSQFYRAKGVNGEDEVDLVLDFRPRSERLVAIEFKTNPAEGPKAGFYRAREAIGATDGFVVHSGASANTKDPVHRLDLMTAVRRVADLATI
jgi:predicted AAA+ superfamily ATPase